MYAWFLDSSELLAHPCYQTNYRTGQVKWPGTQNKTAGIERVRLALLPVLRYHHMLIHLENVMTVSYSILTNRIILIEILFLHYRGVVDTLLRQKEMASAPRDYSPKLGKVCWITCYRHLFCAGDLLSRRCCLGTFKASQDIHLLFSWFLRFCCIILMTVM